MNLKEIRKMSGLSAESVSVQAGITPQHYNYIENKKRRPSVEVAKQIAAALGFPWTWFYEDSVEDGKEEQG